MRRCCFSQSWVQSTQALAVAWIALTPVARAMETDVDEDNLALGIRFWEPSLTLTTGGGYKDNVTLSHAARESSSFVRSGLEARLIRLPLDGTQVTLLVSGEDTRYLTSKSVDYEDTAVAQAEVRKYIGDWQLAFGAEGGYLDEVIDLSITESNRMAVPVRGAVVRGRPVVQRDFDQGVWMSLELPGSRQYLDAPLDDYWELGPKLTLGQSFANRSEVALSYTFTHRGYDNQLARDVTGAFIPGVTRSDGQHDLALAVKLYCDKQRRWRSLTRASVRGNSDDAGGYFDYRRLQISQQLRFQSKAWLISGEVRVARYEFPGQTVSGPGSDQRSRTDVIVAVRAEGQIVKHLRLYTQFDREQTMSNLKLDEYEVNIVSGGVMVEF